MGRPPAFQLYVKDWLTSKKRAAMALDQQAAYMNLLCHCWDTDDCSLPDDPAILAALSELREHWSTRSTPVQQAFESHPKKPGFLTNIRLYAEHQKYLRIQKERRRAGRESGASRLKQRTNDTEHVFNKRSAPVEQKPNSSIPIPSSRRKEREIHTGSSSLKQSPEEVQQRWNAIPGVKLCKALGTTIRARIQARLKQYPDAAWWETFFQRIQGSDFLCGRTNCGKPPFHASLDWALAPTNLDKIEAGNYDTLIDLKPASTQGCQERVQCGISLKLCGQPVITEVCGRPLCAEHKEYHERRATVPNTATA